MMFGGHYHPINTVEVFLEGEGGGGGGGVLPQ